ncbi:MAG: TetR/AcrR family transcriptional regulator [Deltaproteobacteria bacterium]|nr:TetR/AcrR family transcriptional regulator [Deltaproteobacteria bacterium]
MELAKEKESIPKKEEILRIAIALFLDQGYSATSTNAICAAAGINKPTLYYYFKSKRHLFFEAHIKHIQEVLKPYMERAAAIADPRERLAFIIKEFTKIVCKHPELRVLTHEAMSIKDQYFEGIREEWKKHYLLLLNTISELQAEGTIATGFKPSWGALLLLGMITWITYWFDYDRKDEIDDIAETALRVTLFGLFGRENSSSTT